jgi:hypothetical protein
VKPAKNAIIGYSYQKLIAFLLLAKMDVERTIKKIEIEADVEHKFDDLFISTEKMDIYCQMKDFEQIELSDLKIGEKEINIKGKKHKLSNDCNILFVKHIDIIPNGEILGLPSYLVDGVHIISITREEVRSKITKLYEIDLNRMSIMENYFEGKFDKRVLYIQLNELPPIEIYSTELMDKTVNLQEIELEPSSVLMIEGKPGVGKSHLVNQIKLNENKVLYRFWISNQDVNYRERLEYKNFISNLIKDLFKNYKKKNEEEIVNKLVEDNLTLIIDGLDHVENYNPYEFNLFIKFIEKVADKGKVIVFTRPLKSDVNWEIIKLHNWNFEQVFQYMNVQFHITNYSIIKNIYDKTQGYPILVNYIGKYYLKNNELPAIERLEDLNDYYREVTKNLNMRSALAIFLSSHSFFMYSEFDELLDGLASSMLKEFIIAHPYLFEVKLNRISLVHDSLNSFLKSEVKNYQTYSDVIAKKVFESILKGEKRYISRYYFYNFTGEQHKQIIKKYSNIRFFKTWIESCIDIEAVQSFYFQLRKSLENLNSNVLSIYEYYDFSLILNILSRDHISNLNRFLYVYVISILENGYSENDITSSGYVFSMLYFLKKGDYVPLKTIANDQHFDTRYFYNELIEIIEEENKHFEILEKQIDIKSAALDINQSRSELTKKDAIKEIFVYIYVHGTDIDKFKKWEQILRDFIDNNEEKIAIEFVENLLINYDIRPFWAKSIISYTKYKLESLGVLQNNNDFLELSLGDFINKNKHVGSYELHTMILDYLRLAIKNEKAVNIKSIIQYFLSYYERKDYSVINIDNALITFQSLGYITMEDSVSIIIELQEKSEKGIRHLLNSYVEKLSFQDFEKFVIEYDLNSLRLNLFSLPVGFINRLKEPLVMEHFYNILRHHSYSKRLEYNQISNLLHSVYGEKILSLISSIGFSISIDHNLILDDKFKIFTDAFQITSTNQYSNLENNSEKNIENGIITNKDLDYIKHLRLSPAEISFYTDGNHSSFSDLSLYNHFKKNELKEYLNEIFHHAITCRIKSINNFADLYFLVGNVPGFLVNYVDIEVDNSCLFKSLMGFLELSGIEI